MGAVADSQITRDLPRSSHRGRTGYRRLFWLGVFVLAIAVFLRLFRHSTNYDIFVDEITYSRVGQSIALGHGVMLYGKPFYLHPPAFFYLVAGVLKLFGRPKTTLELVLHLRVLNGVIGAIDCGLMMLLVRRTSAVIPALLVGLLMACDPFLLLWDGRTVLETLAMTSAVAGWVCVMWLDSLTAGRLPQTPSRMFAARRILLGVLAGILFAVSVLTKETYAFVGIVPIAVLLLIGRPPSRRWLLLVASVTLLCCLAYWLTIVAGGRLAIWWHQQVTGLQRAAGTKQISGFNQPGHVSAPNRLVADSHLYGATYVVLAAVGLATLAGLIRWWRNSRHGGPTAWTVKVLTVLAACAIAFGGYAVVAGAFEAQVFYMLLVAGLPLLALATTRAWGAMASSKRRGRVLLASAALATILILGYDLAVDVQVRSTRDDTYAQLVSWFDHHARPDSLVDSTDGVSQFLITGARIGVWTSLASVEANHPDYVVVAPGLVDQGYVKLEGGLLPWLRQHGRIVFRATGRSTGALQVYSIA